MATRFDAQTTAQLTTALEGALRSNYGDEEATGAGISYMFNDAPGERTIVAFRGEARSAFYIASKLLARHALGQEGLSPERLQRVIARAAWKLPDIGLDAALEMIRSVIDSPADPYVVSVSTGDTVAASERFDVGSVTFHRDLPDHLATWRNDDGSVGWGVRPPFASVAVNASDEASAVVLAYERIDEARALLSLAHSGRLPRAVRRHVVQGPDSDSISFSGRERSALLAFHAISSDGKWWPGYDQLSAAAGRPQVERTDWERRLIAACRWYFRAAETTWYSEALVEAMSALECLFVPTAQRKGKGGMVAKRAGETCVLAGKTRKSQQSWLLSLYARRNDAVHEGLSMEDDLDVEELLVLVQEVLHRSIFHLNPMHRVPNVACRSLEDVLDASLHGEL